jgi:hypothetical protein
MSKSAKTVISAKLGDEDEFEKTQGIEEIEEKDKAELSTLNKLNTTPKLEITYTRKISHILLGILLIFFSFVIFITFSILIITSKINPDSIESNFSSNSILNFLIHDKHYCLAIPILIPVTFIYLYFRWSSFNYFKYS